MQPLKAWPIILIFASSCGGIPKKPIVELGVIDYPANQVIVNTTQGMKATTNVVKAITASGNRVPLATYDRAISFKPSQWKLVQDYMNSLNRYINDHCQAPN